MTKPFNAMTWIISFFLFLTVVYLATHPEILVRLLLEVVKVGFLVYQKVSACCTRISLWKRKTKRSILLKTKTFDDRPIMKPPSLSDLPRKKF